MDLESVQSVDCKICENILEGAYRNSEIAETVLLFPFRPSGLPATLLQVKAYALRFTSFT